MGGNVFSKLFHFQINKTDEIDGFIKIVLIGNTGSQQSITECYSLSGYSDINEFYSRVIEINYRNIEIRLFPTNPNIISKNNFQTLYSDCDGIIYIHSVIFDGKYFNNFDFTEVDDLMKKYNPKKPYDKMYINLINNLNGQYPIPKDFNVSYFSEVCSIEIDMAFSNLGEIIDKK